MDLTISRAALDEMRQAAAASPDREICGLLLGRGNVVEELLPCVNVAADPRRRFEIDPVALIAVHRAARAGGPALIGHYHSHPTGDATPSACDAAAAEEGSYWVIIGGGELRCWLAAGGGRFIPIAVVEPGNR
jgi:proteasome lid subunit RPN8/RPN11